MRWFAVPNFIWSREARVTERFTKAIEQLGSDKLNVRIGAISAVEWVARDSPTHQATVMEVLAAFIREHSRQRWPPAESGAEPPSRATRPDVQAAIAVIGRWNIGHERQLVNLAGSELMGASLSRADLSGADLTRADLVGADLTGADLTRAALSGADLTDADLTGADLTRADLSGAVLTGADLTGADLTGAHLPGADLSRAVLRGADLTRAYLRGAQLTKVDLVGADFTGAHLTGIAYPEDAPVPKGWVRDRDSGLLSGWASDDTGDADSPQ
jgi:hypothetical protein